MSGSADNRPRVVVLGRSRSILTWFEDCISGFSKIGANVKGISFQSITLEERRLSKLKGLRNLENPKVLERIATELESFSPDVVVFQYYAGLPEVAYEKLAGLMDKIPFVGWLCDNLNEVPPNQLPGFSRVFYFDSGCLPALREFYASSNDDAFTYLPLAVNPDRYSLLDIQDKKKSLVFAGKCSRPRHEFFDKVRAKGIPIELFGPGSKNVFKPWRSRRIGAGGLAKLYAGYLATLNVPQPGNTLQGLNLRAFEVPCCGGVGIYPDVVDLSLCFDPSKEILVYKDLDDLEAVYKTLLNEPSLVRELCIAGRDRVLADHTFANRAQKIIDKTI